MGLKGLESSTSIQYVHH